MTSIVVIGASGKVGTELCLTLHGMPEVEVIAICRSRLSAALLERAGVTCRIGSLLRSEDAGPLLAGADVVCDLSLPLGPEPEIRRLNRQLVDHAIAEAPPRARYVFASTYMALGIGEPGESFQYRLISRTTYGARKRAMERAAFAAGRAQGREIFVLRLGQVHGVMQAVSREILATMTAADTEVPAGPSNTVFVSTIAEALIGIAGGREAPGTYMMVSQPQWSWRELHEHFAAIAGVRPHIVEVAKAPPRAGVTAALQSRAAALLGGQRELITGYVLPNLPDLEPKVRAWYRMRSARAQIAQAAARVSRPYADAFVGDAPGARLISPTDSRQTVHDHLARVTAMVAALTR